MMGNSKEAHATEADLEMGNSSKEEGLKADRSKKRKEAKKARKMEKALAKYEEWRRRKDEEEERNRDPEELADPYAYQARVFAKTFRGYGGRFEDNTSIPCKRYTLVNPVSPYHAWQRRTLQLFSVKVAELTGGLLWPLDVFGMVALRDALDRNRNVIFKRERDNCQTLTDENPYLVLTGPVRGVVFGDPVIFEVLLYVRGTTESDDRELSLLAPWCGGCLISSLNSRFVMESYTSRLSTLEFKFGCIVYSVEATISVQVISGLSPDGFYGRFAATSSGIDEEFVLLDCEDEKVPISGDEIKLSRCVASVEYSKKLTISIKAWRGGGRVFRGGVDFTPQEMGTSFEALDTGFCKMKVTVDWSLFS